MRALVGSPGTLSMAPIRKITHSDGSEIRKGTGAGLQPSRQQAKSQMTKKSQGVKKSATIPQGQRKSKGKEVTTKQIFKGLEISLCGSFINGTVDTSTEQLAGWIKNHGGRFVANVTGDTTHLLCSMEEWGKKKMDTQRKSYTCYSLTMTLARRFLYRADQKPGMLIDSIEVKSALSLGTRCAIVTEDWLIDCLPYDNKKKRLRNTKPYLCREIIKERKKLQFAQAGARKEFEQGVEESGELMTSSKCLIYQL